MENKENNISLEINTLSNVNISFKNCLLYFNVDDEYSWKLINKNSLASFNTTIIKIYDLFKKRTFFCFLNNASVVINNNKATINTFSHVNVYKEVENNQYINEYKNIYKDVSAKINYLNSAKNIGLKLDESVKLNKLKSIQYEYKMKILFSLVECERDEYE
ncbi:hypothetical protein KQ874_02430 [Mycoplasma sp. ES3157-GEN-MYC]|uniref:Uncharacterized protein n=1 Tax=Mycoplasma miroungigenitalium TaxID=754515 RepID=A0A6M4JC66_9MOLU|nr:hypothetical protein [Mycoplasma miroungigenitalium]MBU4690541.1 hypothetical protein [Mycoplasma miroungigenitalium]MBU4691808.1 hypothetical protein [Mycoplasma miroungigenitalium]QJR43669.1 hypothetical protein HLA87_02630 [Mycoplasma miroungigenitalium]